jgi:hypothetical protein
VYLRSRGKRKAAKAFEKKAVFEKAAEPKAVYKPDFLVLVSRGQSTTVKSLVY